MKSPTEIVSSLLLFISYWEGLQNLESCNELEQGVAVLKTLALWFHQQGQQQGVQENLVIQDGVTS